MASYYFIYPAEGCNLQLAQLYGTVRTLLQGIVSPKHIP